MLRPVLILLISWAYVGCAGTATDPVAAEDLTAEGGEVRLNVPDDRLYRAIVRSSVNRGAWGRSSRIQPGRAVRTALRTPRRKNSRGP